MKFFYFFAAFVTTTLVSAVPLVAEADLPICALLCLETEILASDCSLTDITCQCTTAPLVSAITSCVTANCTVRESLTTKRFTENQCGAPVRDETSAVVIASMIGMSFAFIAFVLRMMARFMGVGGTFWWDDFVMCIVMGLVIPLSAFSVVLSKNGLGRDIWMLSFDDITEIAWIYMWDEFMYLSSLPLIKISILLFYLRIFPEKKFRYMCFGAMFLCFAYGAAFLIASIWQCVPIKGAWTNWDGTFEGHCNNINLQGWTSAAFNIILDLIVIILPLPELWKIKISTQKKISILAMFSVGFFITVVSVIRLRTLLEFGGTLNISWDYVSIGYWSTIEIHVGMICACMPAIRGLFKKVFPGALGTETGTKYATPKATFSGRSDKKFKDVERTGGSVQLSSKLKHEDGDDFLPLVNLESANRSHLDLATGPHSSPGSSTYKGEEPQFVMCHEDDMKAYK